MLAAVCSLWDLGCTKMGSIDLGRERIVLSRSWDLVHKAHDHGTVKDRKVFLLNFTSDSNWMILLYDSDEIWWVNLDLNPIETHDRRIGSHDNYT